MNSPCAIIRIGKPDEKSADMTAVSSSFTAVRFKAFWQALWILRDRFRCESRADFTYIIFDLVRWCNNRAP